MKVWGYGKSTNVSPEGSADTGYCGRRVSTGKTGTFLYRDEKIPVEDIRMEYEPGVCNIGESEQRKRYAIGGIGFALALIFLLFGMPTSPFMAVGLFLALFIGFEGAYQGYLQFCAGFAHRGVHDTGDDLRDVEDDDSRTKDVRKAWRIHLYAFLSAAILTATAMGYHL